MEPYREKTKILAILTPKGGYPPPLKKNSYRWGEGLPFKNVCAFKNENFIFYI